MAGRICERCALNGPVREKTLVLIGYTDFRRRFLTLLSYKFREFGSVTALSVLEAANSGVKKLDGDSSRGNAPLAPSCPSRFLTAVFVQN